MQKTVTLSSCEAEYVAMTDAVKEALWMKQLCGDVGFVQGTVKIYVDNQSAIKLAKHAMVRPRTKHIGMRYHWVREQLEAKAIELVYVPTNENIADLFTKNLGRNLMQQFLQSVMGY